MAAIDSPDTLSAVSKVLNTTELLDMVFMFAMPQAPKNKVYKNRQGHAIRKLFLLHRVNKVFYDHIFSKTNQISKEFFLAPRVQLAKRQYLMSKDNRLGRYAARAFEVADVDHNYRRGRVDLIFDIERNLTEQEPRSWARMFISQPPINCIWLKPCAQDPDARMSLDHSHQITKPTLLRRPDGIALGDIVAAAREMLNTFQDRKLCTWRWGVHAYVRMNVEGQV